MESGVWCPQHRTARYARRAIVNVSQDMLLGRATHQLTCCITMNIAGRHFESPR